MAPDDITNSKQHAYICSYCGKGFPIRHQLNMHVLDHTGETRFLCNVCGRGFKRNSYLQEHLKTHDEHRPYVCSVCSKAFRSKYSCALHLRTHTREKPEICAYCSARFRFPMDLNIHGKSAHPEVPSRHHTCLECNKEFTSLSAFSRHMVVAHNTQPQNSELLSSESEVSVAAEILEQTAESNTPLENNYSSTFYGAEDAFECPVGWDELEDEEEPTELPEEEPIAQQSMPNIQENNPEASTSCIKTLVEIPTNPPQKPHSEDNTEATTEDKLTPCPFCATTFAGLVKLKIHMLTHMRDWQHLCQECGKECLSAGDLKTHMNEHNEKNTSSSTPWGMDSQPSDDVFIKSECPSPEDDQSDKDLNQQSDPESNSSPQPKVEDDSDEEKTEEETREDKCLIPLPRKKSPTKRKKPHIPEFTCECGKVYTSETGYREHHLRVHQKVYRYVCVVCNKKFMSKPAWRSHELAHMKIKQYGCDKCDARYAYKKDLMKHQEKHLGLTFECTNCGSSYTTSTSLAKHQERCVDNKTYPCPECPYVASYRTNLKRHKKTVHKDIYEEEFKVKEQKAEQLKAITDEALKTIKAEELGQAPMVQQKRDTSIFKVKLECECGKVFKSDSGLRDHYMRVHEKTFRYSCAVCDKKFMNKTAWEAHELSHQKIKQFACDECDAKYTYKKDLVNHKDKHRGQRYECTECNHTFSTANNLKKHQKVCIEGKLHYCTKCPYIASYSVNLKRHIKNNH